MLGARNPPLESCTRRPTDIAPRLASTSDAPTRKPGPAKPDRPGSGTDQQSTVRQTIVLAEAGIRGPGRLRGGGWHLRPPPAPGAPGSGHGTVPRPDEGHFLAAWSWRHRDSPSVGVRGGSWSAPRDAGRPHAPARALRARGLDLPPPWSDPTAGRGLFSATRGSSSAVLPERIWPVLEGAYAGAAGALCLVVTGSSKARRRRRELRGDGCRSPAEARFLRPRAVGRYVR